MIGPASRYAFMCATAASLAAVVVARGDVFDMPAGLTSLEFVHVGHPGNAPDATVMNDGTTGYGAVRYMYRIGRCEISAAQYTEFLNAVGRADTYGLYNARMSDPVSDVGCNIQRSGEDGGYSYTVTPDYAERAVNYVSYGDAARFCNWLANGQPSGEQDASTTEDGSYLLEGATENEALLAVVRKPTARYAIPTEDEWYKAGYHKNNGLAGDYWVYPTQSDSAPAFEAPPGRAIPPGSANYKLAIAEPYYLTEIGAYLLSPGAYGTFDQGGSMWEWNEATLAPTYRGTRGGSWLSNSDIYLRSDRRYGFSPIREYNFIGFRIVELYEHAVVDFNHDGAVDASDFEHFVGCARGPAIPQTDVECLDARLDDDSDVDQDDFAVFQRCWSGAMPADPECMNP